MSHLSFSNFFVDKNADYDVKVSKVEIIPDPVARGKPATFSISAYSGTALLDVGN
jgi:hypothetical protein